MLVYRILRSALKPRAPFLSPVCGYHYSTLKDAEIEVGYSTSFLGLKCLISEEFSTIVSYVRQLMNSNHPLIGTFGKLLTSGKENQQTYGLVLLLLCKLAASESVHKLSPNNAGSQECGLYQQQRDIAELAEMMFVGFAIHCTIQDVELANLTEKECSDVITGNKLGVLIGDFILAKVSTGAADTEMPHVVEQISLAVAEASEGNFLKSKIERPGKDTLVSSEFTREEYEQVQSLCVVSPFSRFVHSALLVAGHSANCIYKTVNFSKKLLSALQCIKELNEYRNTRSTDRKSNRQKLQLPYLQFSPYCLSSIAEFHANSDTLHLMEQYCGDQIAQARQLLLEYPRSNSRRILLDLLKLN